MKPRKKAQDVLDSLTDKELAFIATAVDDVTHDLLTMLGIYFDPLLDPDRSELSVILAYAMIGGLSVGQLSAIVKDPNTLAGADVVAQRYADVFAENSRRIMTERLTTLQSSISKLENKQQNVDEFLAEIDTKLNAIEGDLSENLLGDLFKLPMPPKDQLN